MNRAAYFYAILMGLLKIEHIFQSTQNCVQYKNMFAEGSKNICPKLDPSSTLAEFSTEEPTKKHAHKGRAILDDKKNERNTVQLTSIRTKGEKRDGHNNQKATHRLQKNS